MSKEHNEPVDRLFSQAKEEMDRISSAIETDFESNLQNTVVAKLIEEEKQWNVALWTGLMGCVAITFMIGIFCAATKNTDDPDIQAMVVNFLLGV